MSHLETSPMEYPVIAGSTLSDIVDRFELGPDTEETREEWWRTFATIILERESEKAGALPANHIGPLHCFGHDALIAYTGECLRIAWESQAPRPKRKRGIDITLCLFVMFLVLEEKELSPQASDNRIFTNVSLLLGPGIEPDTIRRAYKRGVRVFSTFVQRGDDAALTGVLGLREAFFEEFWNEHKSSEKYERNRAFCQKSTRRKSWWED